MKRLHRFNSCGKGHLLFWLLFFFLSNAAWALKDVKISVPKYFRRGEDVTLNCEYNLESKALYVVKWYYRDREFYRYLPKEVPPHKAFPLEGVDVSVDVSKSDDHDVVLKNVPIESSGLYKCLVSVEFPFQTLTAQSYAFVIVPGEDPPRISLYRDDLNYNVGDHLLARCTSSPSYPAANITWYINNREVASRYISDESMRKNIRDPPTMMSSSKLSFPITNDLMILNVKCTASLFNEYYQDSSTINIKPIIKTISKAKNLQRSGSSSRHRIVWMLWIVVVTLNILYSSS